MIVSKLKVALLALAALVLVHAPEADAQVGGGKRVANTAWVGMETVTGAPTKLGFAFRSDGTCIMIDDVSPGEVRGTYRQDGDMVTIQFGNCIYRGRVAGNRLSGTAEPTDGGGSWSFEVTFAPPSPVRG